MAHLIKLKRLGNEGSVVINLDYVVRIIPGNPGTRIILTDKEAVAVEESVDELFKLAQTQSPNP